MNVKDYPDVVIARGQQTCAASENWAYAAFTVCGWKNAKPWQRYASIIGINAFEGLPLMIFSTRYVQYSFEAVKSCSQAQEMAHHQDQILKRRS